MKEKIICIALKQLRLGGYDKLNFSAIAEELGTTRANIHHHFRNKEGLGRAAVERYIEDEGRQMDSIFKRHDGNLPAILSAIEDHLIDMFSGLPELTACAGSQIIRDSIAPEGIRRLALARFRKEAADIREQVTKYLSPMPGQTEAKVDRLTFRIVSTMHGFETVGLIEPDKNKIITHIKGSLTALLGSAQINLAN